MRIAAALIVFTLSTACATHRTALTQPQASGNPAIEAFHAYAAQVETRLEADRATNHFLRQRPPRGEVVLNSAAVLQLVPPNQRIPNAQVQHWLGSTFLPGMTLAAAVPVLQDYEHRSVFMQPEIVSSHLLARHGNDFRVYLRLSEKSVVPGGFDVYLNIRYEPTGRDRLLILSRSQSVAEVNQAADRGILWGLNHYWRLEEADGGLYVECEALVLSRRLPGAVEWLAEPMIAQSARKTLASTLDATSRMLRSDQ